MHTRFFVGVIAGLSWFTLAFEAIGVEAPRPGAEGTLRFGDGSSVRVAGKLAALITEGLSAARSKQYNRAISSFTAALQTNPDKAVAFGIYFNRASAYSNQAEFDKAIADYTTAIQLNPKSVSAYLNRSVCYANKREYKLALRDATMAIQLDPKHANAYHDRGAYYAETGDFDKAIADFSEAIRFNPNSASTFNNRAQAYENIEKFDKATADYDRVIRIAPKDADDYSARGSAYFKKGKYKEAASAFEKALRLFPNSDSALGRFAWFRATSPDASLRNGKEAIRMSMRACELMGWKEPRAISTLAAAYAEAGDFNQAVKYQLQASNMASEYGPVLKEERERLTLYRDHKLWRSKPLSAR
jgi:tetratricopeptide (TPR) repeat protein